MPTEYMAAKIASLLGGLYGGAAMMTFIRPKTVGDAFMRGGLSTGSAMIAAAPFTALLGIQNNWENQLFCGFIVGFLAYSVLGAIANFFIHYQGADIVEMMRVARGKPVPETKPKRKRKARPKAKAKAKAS